MFLSNKLRLTIFKRNVIDNARIHRIKKFLFISIDKVKIDSIDTESISKTHALKHIKGIKKTKAKYKNEADISPRSSFI